MAEPENKIPEKGAHLEQSTAQARDTITALRADAAKEQQEATDLQAQLQAARIAAQERELAEDKGQNAKKELDEVAGK